MKARVVDVRCIYPRGRDWQMVTRLQVDGRLVVKVHTLKSKDEPFDKATHKQRFEQAVGSLKKDYFTPPGQVE